MMKNEEWLRGEIAKWRSEGAVYRAYEGRMVLTDIEIDGKPILSVVKE